MPLCIEIGLGPGHIVLDGDSANRSPPQKRDTPNFQPMSVVAKRLDGSRCHFLRKKATLCCLGIEPPEKRGTADNFRPMPTVTKRLPISAATEQLLIYKEHKISL